MNEYHKIQTVFLRDPKTKFKTLLEGQFAEPEFEFLKGCKWVFTEKVDGTNVRVMWKDGILTFGGKTDDAQLPAALTRYLHERFSADTKFFGEVFEGDACLYGEGYGAKIQKAGEMYRPDNAFVLFDVRVGDWWLTRAATEEIAQKLGIEVVPIVGHGTLLDMVEMVRTGFRSTWGDFLAEGLVARPEVELCNRAGKRIVTKLKHKDFSK